MSFTWKPRLVKTATTTAVAVTADTVGRTALPAFAVISATPRPTYDCARQFRFAVQGGCPCFSTHFAAFPRLKNGLAEGYRLRAGVVSGGSVRHREGQP